MNDHSFRLKMHYFKKVYTVLFAIYICFAIYSAFVILHSNFRAFDKLTNVIWIIWAFVVFFYVHQLLKNVANEHSPFTIKNSRIIQILSLLIILIEPTHFLLNFISNTFFPVITENGMRITVVKSLGWIVFITGCVLVIVSQIFSYGVALQQLSDETL